MLEAKTSGLAHAPVKYQAPARQDRTEGGHYKVGLGQVRVGQGQKLASAMVLISCAPGPGFTCSEELVWIQVSSLGTVAPQSR